MKIKPLIFSFLVLLIASSCDDFYTLESTDDEVQVSSPIFSLMPGTYETDQLLRLECLDSSASIFFSEDGIFWEEYKKPIDIRGSENETVSKMIMAYCKRRGYTDSETVTQHYTIDYQNIENVLLSPEAEEGKNYTSPLSVSIFCPVRGAFITYQVDDTYSGDYRGPFTITGEGTHTVVVTVEKEGMKTTTLTASYSLVLPQTYKVATPQFVPAPNTYNKDQTVYLTSATPGARIYYSINGVFYGEYNNPIPLQGHLTTKTIVAWAIKDGMVQSDTTGQAVYTISYPSTAVPMFSKPGGTYNQFVSITLDSEDGSGDVYYSITGGPGVPMRKYVPGTVLNLEPYGPDATVTAEVRNEGYATSRLTQTYVFKAPTPDYSLASGAYSSYDLKQTQLVSTLPGAQYRYKVALEGEAFPADYAAGSLVTIPRYSDRPQVRAAVRAQTVQTRMHDSEIRNAEYTVNYIKIAYFNGKYLYMMNPDGSDVTLIYTLEGDVSSGIWGNSLEWSPDNSQIAFSYFYNNSLEGKISIFNLADKNIALTFDGESPSWDKTGKKIVYSKRSGLLLIWGGDSNTKLIIRDLNVTNGNSSSNEIKIKEGSTTLVSSGEGYGGYTVGDVYSCPVWSKRDDRILYKYYSYSRSGQSSSIHCIDTSTSPMNDTVILTIPSRFFSWEHGLSWNRGSTVFTYFSLSSSTLYLHDQGISSPLLTGQNVFSVSWSPDNSKILYSTTADIFTSPAIMYIRETDGSTHTIKDIQGSGAWSN